MNSRLIRIAIHTFMVCGVLFAEGSPAFAQDASPRARSSRKEEQTIPKTPSAPPALSRQAPPEVFTCQRKMIHNGKMLPCDSNLHRDADNLRPLVKDLPQALAELDQYQSHRQRLRVLSYNETGGLLLAGTAWFISRYGMNLQTRANEARMLRNVGLVVGLGAAASAFIYGYYDVQRNESHLNRAIEIHNTAHPDTPIEMQVSTSFFF